MRQRVSRAVQGEAKLDPKTLAPDELAYAMDALEAAVASKGKEKTKLEAQMADPELYSDAKRFKAAMEAHAKAEKAETALVALWEKLAEAAMA